MAGANESPRQKMIGMMYLVLTALLAMNVSKDALEAFIAINDELEETVAAGAEKNQALFDAFQMQHSLDPVRVGPSFEKAKKIREMGDTLYVHIEKLKRLLIQETEGVEPEVADTLTLWQVQNNDNYDVPTHLLVGNKEDASEGLARNLKVEIQEYRAQLMSMLPAADTAAVQLGLELKGKTIDGVDYNWENYNFHYSPLSASVAILTNLENEIKNAEYEMLRYLLGTNSKKDIPFDKIEARFMANSNYVFQGDDYNAEIFVAAFNSTKNPEIILENSEGELEVQGGVGNFKGNTSRLGEHKVRGTIRVKDKQGNPVEFPFENSYFVTQPALVVSPLNLNILYAGISNPIRVSVPGIPSDQLEVSISSGRIRKTGSEEYDATVRLGGGTDVDVTVYAKTESGRKYIGKMPFVKKSLPDGMATILRKSGSVELTRAEIRACDGLKPVFPPAFPFKASPTLRSFEVIVVRGGTIGSPIRVRGNRFSNQLKEVFSGLRKGDRVMIEKVQMENPSGRKYKGAPIVITIKS